MVCAQPADFEALLAVQAAATPPAGSSVAANGSTTAATPTSTSSSGFRVRYEVDGFDVHVLNPQFRLACPPAVLQRLTPGTPAYETTTPQQLRQLQLRMVSLLVQVTGHVQYGPAKDAPRGAFTEVFVLVPNWDAVAPGPRGAPRGLRSYLILSQNFRAL